MPISKRNRRGLVLLLIVGILISYTPRIVMAYSSNDDLSISFEEVEQIEQEIVAEKQIKEEKKKKTWKSKYSRPVSAFNPNEYSKNDWMNLGLSSKQADVILKFSKRGLRSNDDLQKIFVIPDDLYDLIKDSTFYPELERERKAFEKEEFVIVDLNTAGFDELKSLPGIGDFYANKIVEYRGELGGYSSKKQLLEIWKFGDERLVQLEEHLVISDGRLKKMNINKASFDELKKHPYISYKVANSIVKMRTVRGAYTKLEDLLESKLIDRELLNKIKNYLKVEE